MQRTVFISNGSNFQKKKAKKGEHFKLIKRVEGRRKSTFDTYNLRMVLVMDLDCYIDSFVL